jgi:cob(I)alamin adenosyltransferase
MPLKKGLVQVYTGDGKGKTTAAFGLALRAVGRGLKVFFVQFVKGGFDYGELYVVDKLPNLELKAFGQGKFVVQKPPSEKDVELGKEAFDLARKVIEGGKYDIVVLDEVNVAVHLGLVGVEEVVELIKNKPKHVELVLTGRYAPAEIVELADLVTEMKDIKHPYHGGVEAREGIEF